MLVIIVGYPQKKFNLIIKKHTFEHIERELFFILDFNTEWDKHFLTALSETFNVLQTSSANTYSSKLAIKTKTNSRFNPIKEEVFYFRDHQHFTYVNSVLKSNPLYIRISLMNGADPIITVCKDIVTGLIYQTGYNSVTIDGLYLINNKVQIPLKHIDMKSVTSYNADIVNRKNCKYGQ